MTYVVAIATHSLSFCYAVRSFFRHDFIDLTLAFTRLPASPLRRNHTIDVLLREAGTQDCNQADNRLSNLSTLDLNNNQIADLKPLSSLTNLTRLGLNNNQIADFKPLCSLTPLIPLKARLSSLFPLA